MEDYRAQVRRMWQILNVVDGVYWRWSKKQGLTANQLVFLYAVDDGAAHTQKELCEEWLIPKTTLNTIVKEYEQAGYIVLENAEGRLKKICLTKAGKEFSAKMQKDVYDAEDKAMAATLKEYSPSFIDALEAFCDNFKKTLDLPCEDEGLENAGLKNDK